MAKPKKPRRSKLIVPSSIIVAGATYQLTADGAAYIEAPVTPIPEAPCLHEGKACVCRCHWDIILHDRACCSTCLKCGFRTVQ